MRPGGGAGQVRIIGGQWKRTPLAVLDRPGLRPTPDRVRKTLFDWLTHLFGGSLEGRTTLDLFAGTGALGLEAASRGAQASLLIEKDRAAAGQLREIVARLRAATVEVRQIDGLAFIEGPSASAPFDVVFVDPPFGQGFVERILPKLARWSTPDGAIYVESDRRLDEADLASSGLAVYRADKAGDVFYHLLRCKNKEE